MADKTQTNPMEKLFDEFSIETTVPSPVVRTVTQDELERINAEAEAAKKPKSFNFLYGMAASENSILNTVDELVNRWSDNSNAPVKEITPELLDELGEGKLDRVALEEVVDLAENKSLSAARDLATHHKKTADVRRELAEAGWKGTTATVLAAMTDLPELAAIGLTSYLVPPVGGTLGLKKAYSVGRAFKAGAAVGAAEAAAFESLRAIAKSDVTAGDVAIAAGASALFGGSISSVTNSFAKRSEYQKLLKAYDDDVPLTDDQLEFLESVDGRFAQMRAIEQAELSRILADDLPLNVQSEDIANITWEEAASKAPRQGGVWTKAKSKLTAISKAMYSENAFTRFYGSRFGVVSAGHAIDPATGARPKTLPSATDYSKHREGQAILAFTVAHEKPMRKWTKRTGGTEAEFNILVTNHIRGKFPDGADPEVDAVARKVFANNKQFLKDNIEANVAGFTPEMLEAAENFSLARLFSHSGIDNVRQKFGMENSIDVVTQLVRKAILEGQPDFIENVKASMAKKRTTEVTDEQAEAFLDKMASGYTKTVLSKPYAGGNFASGNAMDIEELEEALRKYTDIDDAEIEDVTYFLTRNKMARKHKRARARVLLNELAEIEAIDASGNVSTLKFTDLLENDIETIQNAYNFQMGGAYGLAKVGIDTNEAGTTMADIERKIRKEAGDRGLEGVDEEIKALQFMYDGITGRLGAKDNAPDSIKLAVQRAKQFTFAAMMPMAGMSAMMELVNSTMEYSLRSNLKSISRLDKFYRRAENGELDDELMAEIAWLGGGRGEEFFTSSTTRAVRYDPDSQLAGSPVNPKKIDVLLAKIQEIVSKGSGLLGVTAFNRRLTGKNYVLEWERAAQRQRAPFSDTKMLQLGIDRTMQYRIFNAMTDPQNGVKRDANGELLKLNAENWTDQEAAEAFALSLFREMSQNVQEVDLGSMNYMVRSSMGQIFTQFLSFPMASLEQQASRLGARAVSGEALAITRLMGASMLWGSLLYSARVHLNASGRSDKEEYIKRQMAWDRFVVGSVGQVGAASIFMLAFQMLTGTVNGNSGGFTPPAYNVFNTFTGLGSDVIDGKVTEAELRSLKNAIPMAKFVGINQLLNAVAAEYGAK